MTETKRRQIVRQIQKKASMIANNTEQFLGYNRISRMEIQCLNDWLDDLDKLKAKLS